MRTTKCAGIVAGCVVLILVGLFTMDWFFLIFIIPLLIFLFIGVIFFHSRDINIEVTRSLSNIKVFENDNVEVILRLRNRGATINFLETYDTLPDKVNIEKGSNYSALNLKKNEEIVFKYEISCPLRGHYPLGPLCFRVRDYLGMFYKETILDNPSELTVIPQIEDIGDISVKAKANPYPGIMQAKQAGTGTEFFGLRTYVTGDTFKRINWKSFARFNSLMVNEFELESTTDVIILLDARNIQGIGTLKHNPLEYGIKAAVSITSHFLKRRDRVGLVAYGKSEGQLRWVYPESGKKQLFKIIGELVEVQADGNFPLSAVINEAATYMLPKKSFIVFISSLEDDWSIPEAMEHLIALGFNVIVLSPSPIDIEYSIYPTDANYKLAHRLLSFDRGNFIAKLRNSGARVVDWNPTLPLALSLKEVERYQIRR